MLTPIHVAEEQAAILAACPRPRALAALAIPAAPSLVDWSVLRAPSVAAVSAGLGSVAAVRPASDERPETGYGLRRRGEMAGFGFGTAAPAAAGIAGSLVERGSTTPDQLNQQKQNDLTHRREPRTWRPPA